MAVPWLQDLERRVAAAARELESLRAENRRLTTRLKRAERRLAATPEAEAWSRQRERLRQQVAKLVERLEELL